MFKAGQITSKDTGLPDPLSANFLSKHSQKVKSVHRCSVE